MEVVRGIEALLHKSELPEAKTSNDPLDFYEVDQTYEVIITEIEANERKLKVSISD